MKTPSNHSPSSSRQRGSALFIALISLVTMTLAGIALVRSVDTTNLIAGNFAFRQATLHASDVGVETALSELSAIVSSSLDTNFPSGCTSGLNCKYYPIIQTLDGNGIPTVAGTWASVPETTISADYRTKYIIERLCEGPAPVTDIIGKCYAQAETGGGTKKSGGIVFTSSQAVYYRVTVRTTGPRSSVSLVQVILSR